MNIDKLMENGTVYYSLCSGYNFYVLASRQKYRIFGKEKSVIQHVKTGEYFYVSEFPSDLNGTFDLNYWVNLIRNPVDIKHFIWPVDVIEWSATSANEVQYALVFPNRALPVYDDFTSYLGRNRNTLVCDESLKHDYGFHVAAIRTVTEDLLNAWCNFHSKGYAYHAFSKGNMFYNKDTMEVMFDFSFLTQKTHDLYEKKQVNEDYITPEYADPYFYFKKNGEGLDLASDYYTLAVLLFKLFIGILPYDGKALDEFRDDTYTEYVAWYKAYHKTSFFIFDENDDTNLIGGDSAQEFDQIYVKRWMALPQNVRNMFYNVFQTANALRTSKELFFYTPAQWRDALFGEIEDVPLVYRVPELDKVEEITVAKKHTVPGKHGAVSASGKASNSVPKVEVRPPAPSKPPAAESTDKPKVTVVNKSSKAPQPPQTGNTDGRDALRKSLSDLIAKKESGNNQTQAKTSTPTQASTEEGKIVARVAELLNTGDKTSNGTRSSGDSTNKASVSSNSSTSAKDAVEATFRPDLFNDARDRLLKRFVTVLKQKIERSNGSK